MCCVTSPTVKQTATCPYDPGGGVLLVWLERQIARCEQNAIIGMHAWWSRMAENKSSFTLHTLPAPGFILPACQIHIQACHGIRAAVTARRRAPMPKKRRLRAERPQHCRLISPAYPVGRRGAFSRLRHMSRIFC
jgi:hypothetical protein